MALLGCPRVHTLARETCLPNPSRILTLEPMRSVAGKRIGPDGNGFSGFGFRMVD